MKNRISDAVWEQMKVAHASGIGLREIARNMQIPAGTVLARAKREGWTQQVQTAKTAMQSVQSNAITPMQSAAITIEQRANRHVERMAGVSEKVVDHVETMHGDEVLKSIHEVEKFDRMARRTYGLSDNQQTGGSLSLRILAGNTAIEVAAS